MTAARNTVTADIATLQAKVEGCEKRDQESRERDKEIFGRLNRLDDTTADIKIEMAKQFGNMGARIADEFTLLRKELADHNKELAVHREKQHNALQRVASKAGAKWAAIVSSAIGLLAVVADKILK